MRNVSWSNLSFSQSCQIRWVLSWKSYAIWLVIDLLLGSPGLMLTIIYKWMCLKKHCLLITLSCSFVTVALMVLGQFSDICGPQILENWPRSYGNNKSYGSAANCHVLPCIFLQSTSFISSSRVPSVYVHLHQFWSCDNSMEEIKLVFSGNELHLVIHVA